MQRTEKSKLNVRMRCVLLVIGIGIAVDVSTETVDVVYGTATKYTFYNVSCECSCECDAGSIGLDCVTCVVIIESNRRTIITCWYRTHVSLSRNQFARNNIPSLSNVTHIYWQKSHDNTIERMRKPTLVETH